MRIPLSTGTACLAIALTCSVVDVPMAKAAAETATGSVCQLSIPTTDTKFRPKATGARNESTTGSNFVICPLVNANATNNNHLIYLYVQVYSLDGIARNVDCTATSGVNGITGDLKYSTKTASVSGTGAGSVYIWSASDFGAGAAGDPIPGSTFVSVTCLLRPQTAISLIEGVHP